MSNLMRDRDWSRPLPGVLVHKHVDPEAGKFWAKHYYELIGKTVSHVQIEEMDGAPCAVLVLTDGTVATVLCDPEGNGPGFLDIQAKGTR